MGCEHLQQEFKKVMIPNHMWDGLTDEWLDSRVMTPEFDGVIRKSLQFYFEKYFPKYISSMSRTKHITRHGPFANLYFGVEDDGTVSGFPLVSALTRDEVFDMMRGTFSKLRGMADFVPCESTLEAYLDKVDVEVITLESKDAEIITDLDALMARAEEKQTRYHTLMSKYHEERNAWHAKRAMYDLALDAICASSEHRAALIDYCSAGKVISELELPLPDDKVPEGDTIYASDKILDKFRSDDVITFELGVGERKHDPDTLDFWVTNYKEDNMNRINTERPVRPNVKNYSDAQLAILANMANIAGHMKGAVHQMIRIVLPMNIDEGRWIEYQSGNGDWVARMRMEEVAGNPFCMIMND